MDDIPIYQVHIMSLDPETGQGICRKASEAETDVFIANMITNNELAILASPLIVITSGLSFNIAYSSADVAFVPDDPIFGGLSIIQWIDAYLQSWAPNVFASGFQLNITLTFSDTGAGVLATGGANGFIRLLTDPIVTSNINLPNPTYELLNANTNIQATYDRGVFTSGILRYWGFPLAPTTLDIVIDVNTFYLKIPGTYDYTDNFTNGLNLLSFKGVFIHELHHGLGYLQSISPSPYLFNINLFQDVNLPNSITQFLEPSRLRIGSDPSVSQPIPFATYGFISLSNGLCPVPIDNNSPSHIRLSAVQPYNGIMEPIAHIGGSPWTVYDASGLSFLGWSNSLACCIQPGALVRTPNGDIAIENIRGGDIVYDENNNEIEVIGNLRFPISKTKYTACAIFKKDVFGPNKPSTELKITYGHPIKILVTDTEKVVEKFVDYRKVFAEIVNVPYTYCICTKERIFIQISGIFICTYAEEEFNDSHKVVSKHHHIVYQML